MGCLLCVSCVRACSGGGGESFPFHLRLCFLTRLFLFHSLLTFPPYLFCLRSSLPSPPLLSPSFPSSLPSFCPSPLFFRHFPSNPPFRPSPANPLFVLSPSNLFFLLPFMSPCPTLLLPLAGIDEMTRKTLFREAMIGPDKEKAVRRLVASPFFCCVFRRIRISLRRECTGPIVMTSQAHWFCRPSSSVSHFFRAPYIPLSRMHGRGPV